MWKHHKEKNVFYFHVLNNKLNTIAIPLPNNEKQSAQMEM